MNEHRPCTTRDSGFTYLETLVAASLLLVSFLALAGMFILGYSQISGAGNTTMGLAAVRQVLEDARRLPYDNLVNLDGFDTDNPATLPDDGPEREVARRWRYALAGSGVGWTFPDEEQARWPTLAEQGDALRAAGRIQAVSASATITEITATVSVPGRWRPIRVATRIAKM